jgi:hypothetical protein
MKKFYLSPFITFAAPLIALLPPLREGYSLTDNIVLAMKIILLGMTVFLAVRHRRNWKVMVVILLSYSLMAMMLAVVSWWA